MDEFISFLYTSRIYIKLPLRLNWERYETLFLPATIFFHVYKMAEQFISIDVNNFEPMLICNPQFEKDSVFQIYFYL